MESLPSTIGGMTKLKSLFLWRVRLLSKLPVEIGDLTMLNHLVIDETCALRVLPSSIGKLKNLKHLSCEQLNEFPEAICKITSLEYLNLALYKIKSIPAFIGLLKNLLRLDLRWSSVEELPNEIGKLENLKELDLYHCSSLKHLPQTFGQLKKLQELNLMYTGLEEIPNEIGNLGNLTKLEIDRSMIMPMKLKYTLASFSDREKLSILRRAPKMAHLSLARARKAFDISRIVRLWDKYPTPPFVEGYKMTEADAIYTFLRTNSGIFARAVLESRNTCNNA